MTETTGTYTTQTSSSLGKVLLVKVEKSQRFPFLESEWFCTLFPCHQWLSNNEVVELRGGKFSEYVSEHWKEDDFYGPQFLNGVNPCSIKRCSELPSNFPVSEESVKPFLEDGSTFANEMKMGNIFLYDQKILSGIPGKLYHGEELLVPAPVCLLYVNPEKKTGAHRDPGSSQSNGTAAQSVFRRGSLLR
ncbi:arachidonate 12-lipoxygenase, 12R-type-like [Syngnathus typhle]|uniref:arachidonate 12-lipoxygenase, 12R-type-like n=1 Tax=Syngnathus typhle TaxID=161592 RepID=UPI002A6A24CD|nr:arachidonate 12-lipoxygenase, 12R-type-like [Syngnathus typhle]